MTPHQIKELAEKRFEAHAAMCGVDAYLHRLFDTSDIRAASRRDAQKTFAHLPKNPADYVVTINGRMFYAEVKGTDTESFRLTRIEQSQLAGMIRQHAADGEYFVFIHQVTDNEWFRIPGEFFVDNHNGPKVATLKLCNLRNLYGCRTNPFDSFR